MVSRMIDTRPPDPNDEWWISLECKDEYERCGARLNYHVAQLRADTERVFAQDPNFSRMAEQIADLKARSKALEEEFSKWEASLPLAWQGKTIACLDDNLLAKGADWCDELPQIFRPLGKQKPFPGKVDLYVDIWTANFRNVSRVARLLVWKTLIRCTAWLCAPEDYRITSDYMQAKETCEKMNADIIASVCNFLDLDWQRQEIQNSPLINSLNKPFAPPIFPVGEPGIGNRAVAGLWLIWPLVSVSISDYCRPAQRQWVKGKLRYLGDFMGLNRATVMSQVSRPGDKFNAFHFRD